MKLRTGSALIAVILVAAIADVVTSAASTPTPASYRAQLNAMCRSTTGALHQIEGRLAAAHAAGDAQAYAVDVGVYLGLGLREDATIERTPAPATLRPVVAPVLTLLRRVDGKIRAAIADPTTLQAVVIEVSRLAPTINLDFDRAGLRDCGSNQH
jgi:hypothetical protein